MKLETTSTPTTAVGMGKSRAYHFEFNKTMFKTLSSTTYSDPIRAVIRELACNSSDAHQMAGTTKRRFEIHLPTTHEPEFSIRDYGTGMDDQEINDLFTMYGGSNKTDSNDTIGALGIGSKSPYSVTDMFHVITTKDGITRSYTAHVQDGMPRLTPDKVVETPKAPNGVTVQFAVKEKDIWEFHNKAAIALEFFEPMPQVNVSEFVAHKQSYVLRGTSWGLRREAKTAAHGYRCRAIMGKVQYAIGEIDESRTNALQKKILEMPIDMHFELGTLSFQASRESLVTSGADGEKTIAAILAKCNGIVDEAIQTVKDKIDACKDIWEAQILLYSLLNQTSNSMSGGSGMSGLIKTALDKGKLYGQYTNFNLSESKAVINTLDYNHIWLSTFEHNARATKRAKKEPFFHIDPSALREERKLVKATGDPMVLARNRREITVRPDVMFVINDTKFPGDKYIHFHIQESQRADGKKLVYVIHKPKTEGESALPLMIKNATKLIADIGNPPVKLMSELMAVYAPHFAAQRAKRGTTPRSRQIAILKDEIPNKLRQNSTGWTKAWRAPEETELVAPGKKFYVFIDKMVAINAGFGDAWEFKRFISYLVASGKFGIDDDTCIYGVRSGHKALKNNTGEWVELIQHVYNRVAEIMTPQKTLALSLYLTPFTDDLKGLLQHLAQKQPLSSSPAQCFAVALAEAESVRMDNWGSFKWILDLCEQRRQYTPGTTLNFNEKWQQVKALYPMLQFVGSYHINRDRGQMKTLVNYIRQVDEQNFREAACAVAASN
jgi:Histidine kinase-, DNA gyrase B-, and HSP90-like ATPase